MLSNMIVTVVISVYAYDTEIKNILLEWKKQDQSFVFLINTST